MFGVLDMLLLVEEFQSSQTEVCILIYFNECDVLNGMSLCARTKLSLY